MQVNTVILVFLALASVALARNLRCPSEVATNSLFANQITPSKYFRCSELRLMEEFECNDGELFDPELLMCHKPISDRCDCPEITTPCPTPTTTPCPPPATTPTTTTTTTTAPPTTTTPTPITTTTTTTSTTTTTTPPPTTTTTTTTQPPTTPCPTYPPTTPCPTYPPTTPCPTYPPTQPPTLRNTCYSEIFNSETFFSETFNSENVLVRNWRFPPTHTNSYQPIPTSVIK